MSNESLYGKFIHKDILVGEENFKIGTELNETVLSKIILGTLANIKRPAFCSMIPTSKGFCIMLDLGANKESNENQLLQFSIMGYAFAKINNVINPKVAILNIGTEEGKGKNYLQEASDLINKSHLKNNLILMYKMDQKI